MDKREKLLVARKKLKEFQLNKINNSSKIDSKNPQNDHNQFKVEEIIVENNDKCQSNDNMNAINDECSETIISNEKFCINKIEIKCETETDNVINSPEAMNNGDNIQNIIDESFNLNIKHDHANGSDNFLFFQSDSNNDFIKEEPNASAFNIDSDSKSDFNFETENQQLKSHLQIKECFIKERESEIKKLNDEVIRLKNESVSMNVEFINKNKLLEEEINILKKEINNHKQTTEILVAEKAELNSLLSQYQASAFNQSQQTNNSNAKLKSAELKISELENELLSSKMIIDQIQKSFHQLQNNYDILNKNYNELKISREEIESEMYELKENLNIKNRELMNLQKEFEENKNSLSLAELKIQQLTNVPRDINELSESNAAEGNSNKSLVLELSQLKDTLKTVNCEKDEVCKHYEDHVKELNERHEKTLNELKKCEKTLEELKQSEESYIQRLSMMEQQYQREKQKAESMMVFQQKEEDVKSLTKSMDELLLEQESLNSTLNEKELEIESMKKELEELRELRDRSLEISKLVSALESEQLGASRAVSQNQQLKLQLNEMHDAFVMLSNSKLNLTEQLQDERVVGRKLNGELSRVEAERDMLKEELIKKEGIINDLQKDKLHIDQITDQMQHYQVQSNQTRTLQEELENALKSIEILKKENKSLNDKLNSSTINKEKEDSDEFNNKISLSDSFQKLEIRFKESMDRIAELTDEKQKLEHLVLQLQGETETIGEYITLYQKQRAILHTKSQEKEKTFRQLVEQRNYQQVQLHQLKMLVTELLKNENNSTRNLFQTNPDFAIGQEEPPKEQVKEPTQPTISKEKTTAKILDILTDIKECKDAVSLEPNFHPCPWCSGKLITV